MRSIAIVGGLLMLLGGTGAQSAVITVSGSGADFDSIQAALDQAGPGDTVLVHEKSAPYFEKIDFPASGSAVGGYITVQAAAGEAPVIDGAGVAGSDMVLIASRSYVKLIGFEIRNNLGVNDGSGVRILGSGDHIEIRDNRIHDIRGSDAMGITVYGTGAAPLSQLVIDGNEIYDCEPARSEALTLNGNVSDFEVTNNVVRDVNNIGIDFIGGETDIQPDPAKVARNGVCRGNRVYRANSSYGGGFAAGIYVDGGRDIVIENNVVSASDLGIEVGAENTGVVTSGITVRNNVVYANDKVGIVFGGFAASAGRVRDCTFRNNTLFRNDTLGEGVGELWIQYADNNEVRNNIFYSTAQNILLYVEAAGVNNTLDYNLWYTAAGPEAAEFDWSGTAHLGLAAYRSATGQGTRSLFADPAYTDAAGANFHIGTNSAAINAGDPALVPGVTETDIDGGERVNGPRVDIGADETTICGNGILEVPELCDDGNLDDGDGCDSNCTPTGCGNAIVSGGEDCDDGNQSGGDCCASDCLFEPDGSSCDDGDACTGPDTCSTGVCFGVTAPRAICRGAARGALLMRNTTPDGRDKLSWKWVRGAETLVGDFGDPVEGATSYTFCLYDEIGGVPLIAMEATIAAGARCGGASCWQASSGGLRYRDRDGSARGVTRMILKAGGDGKARVLVKGKSGKLSLPSLPLMEDTRVTVQLVTSDDVCWGASYTTPAVRNDGERFKDTYKAVN